MRFYNTNASDITGMQIFGQLGHCPNKKQKPKLAPKDQVVRYLHRVQPHHTASTPLNNVACAHATMVAKYANILTVITPTNPPPQSKAHARLYPDADQWMKAIDVELDKIDARGSVDWSAPNPENRHSQIPFTVNFEYKRETEGNITERKARFALRGDLMILSIHYVSKKCSEPMADKDTVRLLISIVADRKWTIEHMDMKSAYIKALLKYIQSVYVREPPRAYGT